MARGIRYNLQVAETLLNLSFRGRCLPKESAGSLLLERCRFLALPGTTFDRTFSANLPANHEEQRGAISTVMKTRVVYGGDDAGAWNRLICRSAPSISADSSRTVGARLGTVA